MRGIHRSPMDYPNKGQGGLTFSLVCAWTYGWANNRGAGDLRRCDSHYNVTVMNLCCFTQWIRPQYLWGVLLRMIATVTCFKTTSDIRDIHTNATPCGRYSIIRLMHIVVSITISFMITFMFDICGYYANICLNFPVPNPPSDSRCKMNTVIDAFKIR